MAGVVEKTGKNVTLFKAGDEVFGDIYKSSRGSYQEYVCVREDVGIVKKPAGITFEHATAVTVAGLTALQALRDHGYIKSGETVFVNGASGGVGTFCVLLVKAFGADVTGVCSKRNNFFFPFNAIFIIFY
jgi:NADPH:quinone reductase-like Zn-dependent oxidoreductase